MLRAVACACQVVGGVAGARVIEMRASWRAFWSRSAKRVLDGNPRWRWVPAPDTPCWLRLPPHPSCTWAPTQRPPRCPLPFPWPRPQLVRLVRQTWSWVQLITKMEVKRIATASVDEVNGINICDINIYYINSIHSKQLYYLTKINSNILYLKIKLVPKHWINNRESLYFDDVMISRPWPGLWFS